MKRIVLAALFVLAVATFCAAADEKADEKAAAAGTYINKADSKEYITLYADGTFHLRQRKKPAQLDNPFAEISGKYWLNGENINLILTDGGEGSGKLKANIFEDSDGNSWVKEGTGRRPVERPKPMKPIKGLY